PDHHRSLTSFPTRRSSDLSMLSVLAAWLYLRPEISKLANSDNKLLRLASLLTLGQWQASSKLMITVAGGTVLSGLSIALYTGMEDRKSTRLNSSHVKMSYA